MRTKGQAFTYLTGIPFLIIVSLGLAATVWADEATTTTPPPSITTCNPPMGSSRSASKPTKASGIFPCSS